jgi:hypothetical protein
MMKQNLPGHILPRSPPRIDISCLCDSIACAGEVDLDESQPDIEKINVSIVHIRTKGTEAVLKDWKIELSSGLDVMNTYSLIVKWWVVLSAGLMKH